MSVAIVTGSAGLIGSQAVKFFADRGLEVVGIDNNMRKEFFGNEACTAWNLHALQKEVTNYTHFSCDIRNLPTLTTIFKQFQQEIAVIIHAAAQPSHDWAASQPHVDFTVNANGTLNLLELTRQYAKDAVFIYLSTNKVYGDTPNQLPLIEKELRWEIDTHHPYFGLGINETMSIDHTKHSLFGVSKAAADLMVQEYGRYFGMKTACFRGGCLTGPAHAGTKLHGFLSYLMRCATNNIPYTIYGYKGKQVRDNIHSYDLVNALWHFFQNPRVGEVYNLGGGPNNNCSILEAIALCQKISQIPMQWEYVDENRIGDHIWWISDVSKFKQHYPQWDFQYDLSKTLTEIYVAIKEMQVEKHAYV
ncbi:MAG: NAD-dependent epimerase/dehydratase family protein [Proteobacteria bacterium]|nr:NAD-dependent epimerase/dehydratase family protein [Pseudomonadota bacterium]